MHFGQEFGKLCSFSFCYFYFGIWRQVMLYEKDNNEIEAEGKMTSKEYDMLMDMK